MLTSHFAFLSVGVHYKRIDVLRRCNDVPFGSELEHNRDDPVNRGT
jgi:hypothetical protein